MPSRQQRAVLSMLAPGLNVKDIGDAFRVDIRFDIDGTISWSELEALYRIHVPWVYRKY